MRSSAGTGLHLVAEAIGITLVNLKVRGVEDSLLIFFVVVHRLDMLHGLGLVDATGYTSVSLNH